MMSIFELQYLCIHVRICVYVCEFLSKFLFGVSNLTIANARVLSRGGHVYLHSRPYIFANLLLACNLVLTTNYSDQIQS